LGYTQTLVYGALIPLQVADDEVLVYKTLAQIKFLTAERLADASLGEADSAEAA
jgi:hypothetical protein